MLKGIDISNWQTVDFDTLKTDFILMKVSEGVAFPDPKFLNFQKQARTKGLLIGYYHFAKPDLGNTPEVEAEYFLNLCKPTQGEVLCLDFEVSYIDKVVWCKKWLDYVYSKTKCRPVIYLNKSTISGNNWSPIIDAGYGLWMADYSYNPDSEVPSNPWPICAFRQYSNKLAVSGITGVVDANVFYGNASAFKKYGIPQLSPENPSGGIVDPCEAQLEALGVQIESLKHDLGLMRDSRNTWKEKSGLLSKQVEELLIGLDACTANKTTVTNILETEVTQRKLLQDKVKEDSELILKLRDELTKNKPLSGFTTKELFKELFSRIGSR